MKILVDMNLSPSWVSVLQGGGHEAVHWSHVGPMNAPDKEIMDYATKHGYVVFAHDLDFGAILATTRADGPSVVQLRIQNIHRDHLASLALSVFSSFEQHLESGALISVDESQQRVRILPID
jgi:predicted nuclease of predicted toxin-antitoxin system